MDKPLAEAAPVSSERSRFEADALNGFFSGLSRRNVHFAVLRNHENLPYRIGARDIDLVVMPQDLAAATEAVCALAQDMGLDFANHYADERLTQFILVTRVPSGEVLDLKVDFFTNSQIYGIQAFPANVMLSDLRMHHGIPVVAEKFMFLDKWLFHVLVGQPVHEKYNREFADICRREADALLLLLQSILGPDLASRLLIEVSNGMASEMPTLAARERAGILLRMLARNGFQGISHSMRFLWYRIVNLAAPRGIFLSVSGPDGSGKTTVIDRVISQLKTVYGGDSVVYRHFRPEALPRIAKVANTVHAIKAVDEDYANPHRAIPSGLLGSFARLAYYALDYVLGYLWQIRPILLKRQIVLFDRYYFDMICDPGRSRICLPFGLLRFVGRFLPLPENGFFIHVDADEIRRRKQELSLEKIKELNDRYLRLVNDGLLRCIDNNGDPEQAANAIVDDILAGRNTRARRKLGLKS